VYCIPGRGGKFSALSRGIRFLFYNFRVYAIGRRESEDANSGKVLLRGESSFMAKLTAAARKKLPKSAFVEKGTRKYPIPDAAHARDALARSSGKAEHASVVAAIKRKFPKIKITK
jgi:hypothetical protein